MSRQPGAVAILRCALEIDSILFGTMTASNDDMSPEAESKVEVAPLSADSYRKAVPEYTPPTSMALSSTGNTALAGGAGSLAGIGIELKRAKADAIVEAKVAGVPWSWADVAWNAVTSDMVMYVLLPMIVAFVYTWFERRRHMRNGAY